MKLAQRRTNSPKPLSRGYFYSHTRLPSPPGTASNCSPSKFLAVVLFLSLIALVFFQYQYSKYQHTPESKRILNYQLVGIKGQREFTRALFYAWKFRELHPKVEVRAFAIPDRQRFQEWFTKSRLEFNLPEQLSDHLVVFKNNKYLGGSFEFFGELKKFSFDVSRIRYPVSTRNQVPQQLRNKVNPDSIAPSSNLIPKVPLRSSLGDPEQLSDKRNENPEVAREDSDISDWHENSENRNQISESVTDDAFPIKAPLIITSSQDGYLPPQVELKNKVITGYRSGEGKKFTNYRPFASTLASQGWQFIGQAPLLASIILVQDQTSASLAMVKYPRALINNIGWGGQACLGGTKGAQLQCRVNRAQTDGCSYDTLGIQPPQKRLWIATECNEFFEKNVF